MASASVASIQRLTPTAIRNVLRKAVRGGLDRAAVDDFLASVDWTGANSANPTVVRMLGELEGWATAFAEGELTFAQYIARLLSLLPTAEERRRRLPTVADGPPQVAITTAGWGTLPLQVWAASQSQAESGVQSPVGAL